jgi:hypothetical protein
MFIGLGLITLYEVTRDGVDTGKGLGFKSRRAYESSQ